MELSGGEMNYFETLDWFLPSQPTSLPPPKKKIVVLENKKEAYKWVFPKAVLALYLS